MAFKKIGVLTSGGDAPGMNACVKAVFNRATEMGIEVVGIMGFAASDVYCFTWTNDTIGTTIEENGTYKGSDVFTLTADTTVGTWEGQLCVTIDVIEY